MLTKNALYIIALPIGNYSDISSRALELLSEVDCVAAEDTRILKNLAQHHRLNLKQVVAHHNHNEKESLTGLVSLLKSGKSVALVSDAGTPNISDPGHRLTKACYEEGIKILPVPGASALTSALSVCPIGGADHYFCAFLPSKESDRIKKIQSFKALSEISSRAVFFESPHRLRQCLKNILETLGDIGCFIAREITKPYESYYYGPVSNFKQILPDSELKGEFVVCIDLSEIQNQTVKPDIESEIKQRLDQGMKTKEVQKQLQKISGLASKELYSLIEKIKKD